MDALGQVAKRKLLILRLCQLLLSDGSSPILLSFSTREAVVGVAISLATYAETMVARTRVRVPRSLHWRGFVLSAFVNPMEFRGHFRMTRPAFTKLLSYLEPSIAKKETAFGRPISPAVRLAIFLFFCGHGCSLHQLSAQFGVGKSTASTIVREVAASIVALLGSRIAFPSTRQGMIKTSMAFEDGYGIPGCVGALDGCHVRIVQQSVPNSKKYFNRKSFYSINVSAVVDRDRRFLDIDVRWPGSVGDSRIFNNSAIGRVHEGLFARVGGDDGAGRLMTGLREHRKIPFFLLADSAYANSKHVVTTFDIAEAASDPAIGRLNRALAGMRYPVECAFGILKSRWRVLSKAIETARTNIEAVPSLIGAVCILHNFVVDEGDTVWDASDEDHKRAFYFANFLQLTNDIDMTQSPQSESKTRDALLEWMRFRESVRG